MKSISNYYCSLSKIGTDNIITNKWVAFLVIILFSIQVKVQAQCNAYYNFYSDTLNSKKIYFTDLSSSSYNIISRNWNFGDGTNDTAKNPVHTYASCGNYDVTLNITDSTGCTSTWTYYSLKSGPIASYNYTNDTTDVKKVNFTNYSTGNKVSYQWYFGDGTTSTAKNPIHVYASCGTSYLVRLTVYDSTASCYDSTYNYIYLNYSPWLSYFTDSANLMKIHFSGYSNFIPGNWNWDFGDGTTSSLKNPSHLYTVCGNYNVKLTVSDSTGVCTNSYYSSVYAGNKSWINYTVDISDDRKIYFTGWATDTNSVTKWKWNFGDGTTDSIKNPTHLYFQCGYTTITLITESLSGCIDTSYYYYLNVGNLYANIGYSPDTIIVKKYYFYDYSSSNDSITGWLWNFGDSTTSTLKNPIHTYAGCGTYQIKLTVTDYKGCSNFAISYIYIGNNLYPYFYYSQDTVNKKSYNFIDYTGGTISSWLWNFGDGTTSNVKDPVHVFPTFGSYNVCLTITDNSGCTYSSCNNVDVKGHNDCYASFGLYLDTTNTKKVYFNNYSYSKTTITQWKWKFGDGDSSFLQNPSHIYSQCGNYTIELTIFDSLGCYSVANTILNVGSNPSFWYNTDSLDSRKFYFINNSIGSIASWKWYFGDGDSSTLKNPIHVFANCSTNYFFVTLTVVDSGGCTLSYNSSVSIYNYTYMNIYQDSVNKYKYHFKGVSYGPSPASWSWNFGDGITANVKDTSHTYANCGNYYVNLKTTDLHGCSQTNSNYLEIKPDIIIAYTHDSLNYNKIYFTATASANIVSWNWNFGDGDSSNLKNPTHTYNTNCYGNWYNITLQATDSSGCIGTYYVYVDFYYYSYFEYNSDSINYKTLHFKDKTNGNPISWKWEFGDGSTSTLKNPSHTYTSFGYFTVCLKTISANGCSSYNCNTIWIDCYNKAYFSSTQDSLNKYHYLFKDYSSGNATNWYWTFGNGASSNLKNPDHTYSLPGYYNVCLTVFDSTSSCQNTYCGYINIYDSNYVACYAYFGFKSDTATNQVIFTDSSGGTIASRYWDFGDGTFSYDKNPLHTYMYPGNYYVCLTVYDWNSGCQNQFCKFVNAAQDTNTCYTYAYFTSYPGTGNSIYFYNQSYDFTQAFWNFGDGNTSTDYSPNHVFPSAGYYNVCLTVYDSSSNCQKNYCMNIKAGQDSNYCYTYANFSNFPDSNKVVHFSNNSYGYTNAFWDFGDGTTSSLISSDHTYIAGNYYVCLTVSDNLTGCMATWCDYVIVGNDSAQCYTYADFTYFPDSGNGIFFNNYSQIYTRSNWDFGDGNFSMDANPYHIYTISGYYQVCLTVFDSITNCMNTLCYNIKAGKDSTQCYTYAYYYYFPDPSGNGVNFSSQSQGATDLFWNFGDNSYSSQVSNYHIYANAGYYNVCLTARDSLTGCMNTWCQYIKAGNDTAGCYILSDFQMLPDTSGNGVSFNNLSYGYNQIYWDFGDNSYSTDVNPYHIYVNPGYYNVCLTVYDSISGCSDYKCKIIKAGQDSTGCYVASNFYFFIDSANNTASFQNQSYGYTDLYWDMGDGNHSNIENPTHIYSSPGFYNVCLSAIYLGADTCIDTYCQYIEIKSTDTAVTNISCNSFYSFIVDSATKKVTFNNMSAGNTAFWYWNFGDFTVASNDTNPVHTFSNNGYYEVCLTVYNSSGCQNTFCQVIAVGDVSQSVFSSFSYYTDSVTSTAYFQNNSYGNVTQFNWDFGDTQFSTYENPAHTYPTIGWYLVCLTAKNGTSGATHTKCKNIEIGNQLTNPCLFKCVWPGDANSSLEANHYDLIYIGLNYGLTGPPRDSVSIRWIGHSATNWTQTLTNGANARHNDCNGNGIVDIADVDAITQNFAYSHPYNPGKTSIYNVANPDLYFEILTPNAAPGSTVELNVKTDLQGGALDLYGLGYELKINKDMIEPNSIIVSYDSSWLGVSGELLTFSKPDYSSGVLSSSITRNNKTNKNGSGILSKVSFVVKSTLPNIDGLDITLTTDYGMNALGDSVYFNNNFSDTLSSGISEIFKIKDITVYPNPAKDKVRFVLPYLTNAKKYNITLFNSFGQIVYNNLQEKGGNIIMDVKELNAGLYFLQITSEKTMYREKVDLIK